MRAIRQAAAFAGAMILTMGIAQAAGTYADTVAMFKNAGQSADFFSKSYGYAVFPTIGKGGFGVGAAHGSGRVYVHGVRVGDTTMNQLSVGFQAGGQAYSEIVFFEDKRAFDAFTSGSFEFDASAGVVAITAGASAASGTNENSASASGGKNDAKTVGTFRNGMAVFTIAKGGLMFDAAVAGQKFSYSVHNKAA